MGKTADRSKSSMLEKRGGYEPGPKKVSDLKPPPKTPGAGATSAGDTSTKK
ncbi:MAG: hypothetical protein ACRDGK_02510 [Actinomycetota bacterium]